MVPRRVHSEICPHLDTKDYNPRMWLPFRAWWYLHVDRKKPLPPDVKEYVFRRANRMISKLKDVSPEEKLKLSEMQLVAAVTAEPGEISEDLRGDLLAQSLNRLGEIPAEKCAKCGIPVFTHAATRISQRVYCQRCAKELPYA